MVSAKIKLVNARKAKAVRVLQVAVKKQYFDEMTSGMKMEEYRLVTPYWKKRLEGRDYDRLIITLGYPLKTDASKRLDVKYQGYTVKTITHPHFGCEPVQVFAIKVELYS